MLRPETMGRDRFEALLMRAGFRLTVSRSYTRTTYAYKGHRFDNLITGLDITATDQLWVSDITYFRYKQRFYYLTFITDVFTRKIIGFKVSDNLMAEANIKALKMALKGKNKDKLKGLIHHSDRGTQYIHHQYLALLEQHGIQVSMGNKAWENAHAERINGIIKNEYLNHMSFSDNDSLTRKLRSIIRLYNSQRPHGRLPAMMTPEQMETSNLKNMNYKVKINY